MTRLRHLFSLPPVLRLGRDERGVSAVEFALIVPVMSLVLVAVLEFGTILYQRFEIDSAVSAGANYALVSGAAVTAADGADLAADIASVVNARRAFAWADLSISVNNGPTYAVTSGGPLASGTAANADACYCPTGNAQALDWGAAVACTTTCPDGTPPGKFVRIALSRPYSPIFFDYGIVRDGAITIAALVQTE